MIYDILLRYGRSSRWSSGFPRMLLELVLGFESHMGRTAVEFIGKKKRKMKQLAATIDSSMGTYRGAVRCEPTREGRAEVFSR